MVLAFIGLIASTAVQGRIQDVFVSKSIDSKQAFDTYRIPALCRTSKGTLLAFAEGRRSVSDQASNVLVVKRREAGQKSWSDLKVVQADEPASLNNPCVLATKSGRVWMMYQRYPLGYNERTAAIGTLKVNSCHSYVTWSDDDGASWSHPRDITWSVKGRDNHSDASGPGVGIELEQGVHKGRLVFPCNEGGGGQWTCFTVYTDDQGQTWKRSTPMARPQATNPNECQVVELSNGNLLMNMRNQARGHYRLESVSKDGGETWSEAKPRPDLADPACEGSIIRVSWKPSILAFCNPANTQKRVNGVLRISLDEGKTWKGDASLTEGSFAYSCLVALGGAKVGLVYEEVSDLGSRREGYRIRYREVDLAGTSL